MNLLNRNLKFNNLKPKNECHNFSRNLACTLRTGLCAGWEIAFRLPGTAVDSKTDDEVKYKSSAMYVQPEQKLNRITKSSLLFRLPNLHKTQCCLLAFVVLFVIFCICYSNVLSHLRQNIVGLELRVLCQ